MNHVDESDNGKLIDPTVSIRDTWTGECMYVCVYGIIYQALLD